MSLALPEWQHLNFLQRYEIPKLFYRFHAKPDAFDLHVTDLVNIWDGSLNKYAILAEASTQQSSIDPSDSASQLKVLIQKLQESLSNGKNALVSGQAKEEGCFRLHTKIALPPPLKALAWTFNFSQQDSGSLSKQLLVPSLRECLIQKRKLQSLDDVVKEKDHVISRLLDKVESTGMDFSSIFPGITGLRSRKRNITVKDASNHVPGMAAFDTDSWKQKFYEDGKDLSAGLGGLLEGSTVGDVERQFQEHFHSRWTSNLPPSDKIDIKQLEDDQRSKNGSHKKRKLRRLSRSSTQSSGEDFQRQETPPSLRKKTRERSATLQPKTKSYTRAKQTGGSTFSSPSPSVRSMEAHKLGSIGSRNHTRSPSAAITRRSPSSSPQRVQRRSSSSSSATVSSSDSEPRPAHKSKQMSKIGALGGRNKVPREPSPDDEPPPSTTWTPSRKIGVLGGRPSTATPENAHRATQLHGPDPGMAENHLSSTPDRSRARDDPNAAHAASGYADQNTTPSPSSQQSAQPFPTSKADPAPETAEEKANRKRDELKRRLEGGGTKVKRRKF